MIRHNFLSGITRYWWLPLLTGLVCIGLGIWTILSPAQALPVIAATFAYCLLAIGIFDAIWGFSTTKYNPGWGWDLCLAAIDIIAGVWMLSLSPAQMTMAFLYIVVIWMIFAAFNGVGHMFAVSMSNPWTTFFGIILLIATLFFSFWLLISPIGLGVTAWIWLGIALICYGVFKVAVGCKIKTLNSRFN